MKKTTLLFSLFLLVGVYVSAQTNLVANPSFETWTDGLTPDNWTIPANATHAGSLTWSKETTITKDGSNALKVVIGTTQNPGIQQIIPITAGKTYTVSVSYYVESGDLTDVRIWSSFKIGDAFFAAADWTTAVAADAQIQNKLQGSGTSTTGYFTIANGTWGTYTTDFVAPANTTAFVFEVRTYKSATAIWDNFSLVEKTTGLNTVTNQSLNVWLNDSKKVTFNAAYGEKVEVFNSVGQKVLSQTTTEGKNELTVNNKGITIVKVGNRVGKIIL